MKNKIDKYFKLQEEIFVHCRYMEDWHIYPMVDYRDFVWAINKNSVVSAKTLEDFATGEFFEDEILKDRFLSKSIFEGQEFTLILVDTHCDNNKYLILLDNNKKITK